jgi:hypothetical protein
MVVMPAITVTTKFATSGNTRLYDHYDELANNLRHINSLYKNGLYTREEMVQNKMEVLDLFPFIDELK